MAIRLLSNETIDGNVGIGTTSPAQPLSVHGNFLVRTTNTDGNKNRMQCLVGGSADAANLYLYYGNSGDGTVSVRINAQGDSYFNGGNVGIGTNNPQTALTLPQGTGAANKISWYDGTPTFAASIYANSSNDTLTFATKNASNVETTAMVIDIDQYVGIGITSPDAKLHIQGSSTEQKVLEISTAQSDGPYTAYKNTGSGTTTLGFIGNSQGIMNAGTSNFGIRANNDLTFSSGGSTERMRITSAGNVQIGSDITATPETLTVQAYTQNQAFSGKYSSSGYLWFLRNETGPSGRFQLMNVGSTTINLEGNTTRDNHILEDLGIGTTSPNQKLDVAGSISSGGENKATSITHDTSGNVRAFVHNFSRNKDTSGASNVTLVDISGLGNFHQAMFYVQYGTRLQAVSDSTTGAVVRTYGVNRFNGGTLQVTETNAIAGSSNSITHALVNVEIVSNTQYRLRIEFSSTLGASSFATGLINGFAVGDAFPTITFAEGTAGE